ncbi:MULTISPECIES: 30S ribosomal protein S8 [Acidiplasma]|jgi:small subunit ribosomal protein S8|uniref:Small ribosomal subunit protein uS8 n=2 Tax=Acidiplasma TaxID=507753 RepID=A0A0Q0WIT6_9ARCH|nr:MULTISPECIES: 30S ribosomal protein S8 [Acidiplasma]KJE49459.1 30S ribosomal protein S8 [Acidiplasma sp. MBA-1]KPV46391.1 30S ribosomal protein S8 [Acidiplasma aeolicum]KQB35522.1 30S ribosomal protein S8 [Acidiplasma cupricumulans]KQB36727.1 30S ribosomal protein S8 [Acidiplasma aeolicum]WMT54565.1 MAG: 30S ribosomal protein S8 [Acidiplasma sp.]
MKSDPLNDVINSIKMASRIGKNEIYLSPASVVIGRVLKVMQDYNYIKSFEVVDEERGGKFKVVLSDTINNCGVIKPRLSVKKSNIEKYEARYLPAQDFGIIILTTTKGIMSHLEARKYGIGGKLMAYVY